MHIKLKCQQKREKKELDNLQEAINSMACFLWQNNHNLIKKAFINIKTRVNFKLR